MPPKIDVTILIGRKDNAVKSLYELFEEFQVLYQIEPEFSTLEKVYKELESKFRSTKKLQEIVADRLVETLPESEKQLEENSQYWAKVKSDFLICTQNYAKYEKKCTVNENAQSDALEAMTSAVTKMADILGKPKEPSHGGLEKISVPIWDGRRKSYANWKNEFNHWMVKYKQDADEQLQRFRKALPKNSFWTNLVKSCKSIEQAWEILDTEFGDQRKLMDELLNEITYLKQVKSDAKSLSQYAAKITEFVNNLEQNGCAVKNASEGPFVMSQLLSKLDYNDNVGFGREMYRLKQEENVTNLVDWLNKEGSLRSRGMRDRSSNHGNTKSDGSQKSDNRAALVDAPADDTCPQGCDAKHLLSACPVYQSSTVDERWEIVKQNKRCRKCLRLHHTNDCKKADGSTCDKCTRRHHRSLHNERRVPMNTSQLNPDATPFPNTSQEASNHSTVQGKKKIPSLCPVQKVKLKDKDGNLIEVLAMIDSGSNTSLISKNVKTKLGISGPKTHLTMNLAGGHTKSENSEIVNITVVSTSEESIEKSMQAYTVNRPCSPAKTISSNIVNNYPHLKSISNKLHLSGGTVELLIGTDFAEAFIDIHTIPGNAGEPIAKRNCFGWYVIGKFSDRATQSAEITSVDVGTVSALEDMKTLLSQDLIGVKPTELCTCSDNILKENKFVKAMAKSTQLIDGRVQVRMPWKDDGPPKQSNYEIAYKRMLSSEKTFQKKNCFKAVQEEVEKLLEQEFITEVPPEEVNHNAPAWYLPLQVVVTPERTTKVRLVFDASAKGPDGQSLNDHLEKGPNYINSLPNVLMAWRWDEVAYTGDIRKMFNQVTIHPDDQVFHRFLWRTNTAQQPKVYQWTRLIFGDKPSPDIATEAIITLAKAAEAQLPEAAKELLTHAYVDDIGGSRRNEKEVKQITNEIDAILDTGQFQIKAWHSNKKNVDQSEENSVDFLGHRWNKADDKISFKKQQIIAKEINLTKRNCLAYLSQLWDPVGLVMPVTIDLRIDMQELWSAGYSWDETLPKEIQTKWMKNVQILNSLLTHEFRRQLKPQNVVGLPGMHGFSDGGEKAYGAAIFLRWKLADETYSCVPLMIKAFVAPLKKKTIPRLELMGCLALARLYNSCKEALEFAEIGNCRKVFWIDSQTVLTWIKVCPRKFKPFVSVRVAEIQETMDTQSFKYIRTGHNPADALTRGIPENKLKEWNEGPPFLKLPEEEWPTFEQSPKKDDEEVSNEMKTSKDTDEVNFAQATQSDESTSNPILEELMQSCSSFRKARKTLAYILRFVHNVKARNKKTGQVSVEELKQAELMLFKWTQRDLHPDKIDKMLMIQADDDGIQRAHGRLENVQTLPADMRNPIVLPRNHPLVKLLLRHLHEIRGHCGYKSLMHEARRRYWIIGLRNTAKQLTRTCISCKKLRRKPMEQLMGQVPSIRASPFLPAFSHTAMDMFGPFQIKLNRKTLKEAHVIIFTCMTSRAIHLELCTDKSTDTFLMAFRRFASLRGHPLVCWSDCGTNFKGAQGYMSEVMKDWNTDRIQSVLADVYSCQFKWKWNIPHASHMNGVVESLIKSVRQAIYATCKDRPFTEEQWRTTLAEMTYMINSRPLYPSSDDIWECPPITPNDLIIGPHIAPPCPEPEDRVNPRNLVKSTQRRIEEFWTSWQKYFAPTLLPRNKWFRTRDNLQVGDLVLEIEGTPRRKWKMALVTEVYPGQDNLVRKARIKTASSQYDRPIHKLCLIATRQELDNGR